MSKVPSVGNILTMVHIKYVSHNENKDIWIDVDYLF